ncbi:uncharacterized protein K460DRAFT_400994 [Cucurbitaria berberidis CBS 394.84]|uniref:DH domain-containing protein n=1 Tax=Cucurbitaria berberidis CBS 394.84 TaxID=1168544 RepID=A0A9P4GTA6_9PLEO|nr:uncharacterized protein K460DRAFT_400994 [Cucurbitaria berberidis CBS 394.84]KAF1850960.1 hypothetical protein K460DRAFT_400994 [Cucurbitaria berberidis CBS 394.84]
MEPISAVLGVMAALPQCIKTAKDLYDLRSRYQDASLLITAIYSESQIIAASLSQVQNLLYHDALQSKPQLLETFDHALTGWIKAEKDDLKFKDRAKYLWKEDTFKELLTQSRGQQSALSLLVQGLQMESIAEIRKLVQDNSVTLNQVVKRSRTLRQAHPRVKVPESIFGHESRVHDCADADSIIRSAEFAFDDEVISSKAYRKAMAFYTAHSGTNAPRVSEKQVEDVDLTPLECAEQLKEEEAPEASGSIFLTANETGLSNSKDVLAEQRPPSQLEIKEEHEDLFDALEKDILAFMPQITFTAPYLNTINLSTPNVQRSGTLTPKPLRSFSEGHQAYTNEEVPPLPPRRPSGPQLRSEPTTTMPKVRSSSSDDSICTSTPSVLSKMSTASSYTLYESSRSSSTMLGRPLRTALPFTHQAPREIFGEIRSVLPERETAAALSPLRNADMREIWISLLDAENKFIDRMTKFRNMYDNIIKQWPILEKHLGAILVGEQLTTLNKECLLQAMEQQMCDDETILCNPSLFETWTSKTSRVYREYCQQMPHAASSLSTTQNMDPKFTPFVHTLGLSIAYFGMGWQDYLDLPNVQLQSYIDNLNSLISIAETLEEPTAGHELARLKSALGAVTWLRTLTSTILDEAQNREDVQNLERRIYADANLLSKLCLLDPTRRIRHRGNIAMKLKSQGTWQSVHVMLLDNYLLWGKVKPQKKSTGDKILILDPPVAISDSELNFPCDQHQFQKASMFDDIPRGSVVYIMTVKNKNIEGKPHMLGLHDFEERKDWWDHLTAAIATLESAPE